MRGILYVLFLMLALFFSGWDLSAQPFPAGLHSRERVVRNDGRSVRLHRLPARTRAVLPANHKLSGQRYRRPVTGRVTWQGAPSNPRQRNHKLNAHRRRLH